MRIVRKACALLRGAVYLTFKKLFNLRKLKGGKRLSLRGAVSVQIDGKSRITIGRAVNIGKDAVLATRKTGVLTIGDGSSVGAYNRIICHQAVAIGKNTLLAPGVMIYDHDHLYSPETGVDKRKFKTSPVEIGDNCWIGANAIILRGTKIGNNCVVGAGAVIKGEYPDGSVIIQKRETIVKERNDVCV